MQDPRPTIHLLTTGGTIDKDYGTGHGIRDLEIGPPVAPDFLRKMVGTAVLFDHVALMAEDSLDIKDSDRATIAGSCFRSSWSKILITHGTDTILETAEAIHRIGCHPDLTIVLTGAARPAVMREEDARFHLGLAVAACLTQPPGIWIAINGIHQWDKCYKHASGLFIGKE